MKQALSLVLLCGLALPAAASRLLGPKGFPAGSNPRGLAVADFNSDGYADVAVANFGSGTLIGQTGTANAGSISVFWGSAAGLTPGALLPLDGDAPRGLAAGNVTDAGHLDLLATLYASGRLALFHYQGNNTFSAPVYYAVGSQPVGVATGAFNGVTWVAVADYGSDAVALFTAAGGTLQPSGTLAGFDRPTDVQFYAPKNARTLTLLVANYGADSLSRVVLNPDGTAQGRTDTAVAGHPCKLAVGDLNGDGIPDVAVARFSDNAVSVFLGQPDGSLAASALSFDLQGKHPNGLALGILCGLPRLVVADRDSDLVELVRFEAGSLTGSAAVPVPDAAGNTGAYGPVEVGLGDTDGGGGNDIVVTHMRSGRMVLLRSAPPAVPLLSSSGHTNPGPGSPPDFEATWTAPYDLTGIDHYLVAFDQAAGTIPSGGAQTGLSFSGIGLAGGTYYLHVRAVDASGKAGATGSYPVSIPALAGGTPRQALAGAVAAPQPFLAGGRGGGSRLTIVYSPVVGMQMLGRLYDLAGGLAVQGEDAGGLGRFILPADGLASGIYLLDLQMSDGGAVLARRTMKIAVIH